MFISSSIIGGIVQPGAGWLFAEVMDYLALK
jgi:hypothetical protein